MVDAPRPALKVALGGFSETTARPCTVRGDGISGHETDRMVRPEITKDGRGFFSEPGKIAGS